MYVLIYFLKIGSPNYYLYGFKVEISNIFKYLNLVKKRTYFFLRYSLNKTFQYVVNTTMSLVPLFLELRLNIYIILYIYCFYRIFGIFLKKIMEKLRVKSTVLKQFRIKCCWMWLLNEYIYPKKWVKVKNKHHCIYTSFFTTLGI